MKQTSERIRHRENPAPSIHGDSFVPLVVELKEDEEAEIDEESIWRHHRQSGRQRVSMRLRAKLEEHALLGELVVRCRLVVRVEWHQALYTSPCHNR